ncbi:MmgE/PrpD family protein [Dactylosporangium sp. CS-047395]|uniref:MmgE/PrpD family protein n=1 Tax=Dactylosporangium sp. CS-047395 TaxID=3239936 RepID=UPI003D8A64F9
MAEPTLSRLIAELAADTDLARLPADVVASTRMRVLDTLGLALRARDLESSQAVIGYVADQGGRPEATAIGVADKVPAALAALVNGTLAHSLDYDDTHLPSVLHPSAGVVPAALAAAEAVGASGADLVAAVAVGLETCVRIGMAGYDQEAGNSTFFEHGQHATSICGALGGAVAAAMLHGLDADGIQSSLGVAASMASGIIEANRTGGTVKRMHCGWAAHSAVTAADLTRRGLTGPPTALEGRFGFFQAFLHGRFDATQITDGLGERWSVPGIFFKPYPANHFTHTTVDAAAELRRRGVHPGDVESIQVGVPGPVIRTIGEPIEVKRAPVTGYQAQFSAPYAVTVGLLGGGGLGAALEDYTDELATDPARRELMAKVSVVADPRCDAIFPHQFPAVLTARLRDGRTETVEVLANRGGDAWRLTDDEIGRKFAGNAPGHERLRAAVLALDTHPDVRTLLHQ